MILNIMNFVCACAGASLVLFNATGFIAWHLKEGKTANDIKMLFYHSVGTFFGFVALGTALINLIN